jgi:hypothetical protein
MAEPVTAKHVCDLLRQRMRQRADIGVGKALLDCVLESSSPFDSKSVRSPKRWFVLLLLLGASTLGCFVYFNGLW